MTYDYSDLNGRIVQKFGTQYRFAEALKMSEHSLSAKLNGKRPWKQADIENACCLLDIKRKDIPRYFFNLMVQDN